MDNTLFTLVNPEFDFSWNGEIHHVRKANLEKIVMYQERARALAESKDTSGEIKLTGYCIYLVLRDVIPDITEAQVMSEAPGDIDTLDVMLKLGFLNPMRMKTLLQAKQNPNGEKSLPSSPSVQDGLLEKSVS